MRDIFLSIFLSFFVYITSKKNVKMMSLSPKYWLPVIIIRIILFSFILKLCKIWKFLLRQGEQLLVLYWFYTFFLFILFIKKRRWRSLFFSYIYLNILGEWFFGLCTRTSQSVSQPENKKRVIFTPSTTPDNFLLLLLLISFNTHPIFFWFLFSG